MSKQNKGFTLIELLVVIAIIGILAGVILSSLGTAREKAADARIRSTMAQIRNAIEINTTPHGTFDSGACTGTGFLTGFMADMLKSGPSSAATDQGCITPAWAGGTTTEAVIWRVFQRVNVPDAAFAHWYCADSTGFVGMKKGSGAISATAPGTPTTPASTTTCATTFPTT